MSKKNPNSDSPAPPPPSASDELPIAYDPAYAHLPAPKAGLDSFRAVSVVTLLFLALVIVSVIRLKIGGVTPDLMVEGRIDFNAISQSLGFTPVTEPIDGLDPQTVTDILEIRRDRLLIALIVGAALAMSGAILQTLLRNPLASPYILGVSSGAALGVCLFFAGALGIVEHAVLNVVRWIGILEDVNTADISQNAAAFLGALVMMFAVYVLSQKRGRIDPVGLLLVGVVLNAINNAAILFINYINPLGRVDLMGWMMGNLDDGRSIKDIAIVGCVVGVGLLITLMLGRAMDVATLADHEARSLGLRLGRLRFVLFVVASVVTAGAVMLAGPIGFVGLIAPHIVRLMAGPSHRSLVLGSVFVGAILVIGADTASMALSELTIDERPLGVIPIGVFTALIGGPVFVLLLRPYLGRGMDS